MCLAVPGRVEKIFEDKEIRMGKVDFGGVVKEVCLAYLPDIQIGDYAIVHVGFAISRIDEVSAQQTLRTFEELGLLEDELQELREAQIRVRRRRRTFSGKFGDKTMKHLTEYRDGEKAKRLAEEISRLVTKRWSIMEVCGGQTHSIIRNGIDQILPNEIEMIHGPGCPVCVTPLAIIDKTLAIASRPNVIFCSFGDMLRVPGSKDDLLRVKGAGGDVRVIYSPLDAVKLARENPQHEVVFLAIGFETTAPANAMAVKVAKDQGITNFSALVSHVLVPPAIEAIMNSPGNRVNAFLAAGHVCCVTGFAEYPALCEQYKIPIVVTGFEPLDLLEGIRRTVMQLENGQAFVDNAYSRVVSEQGNVAAQAVIDEVFQITDRRWRGIGMIPKSGWRLSEAYRDFDAENRFAVSGIDTCESTLCRAGEVLKGAIKPNQCEAFGKECTPRNPLGATMVSSEGACAAYFNYGRVVQLEKPNSPVPLGEA